MDFLNALLSEKSCNPEGTLSQNAVSYLANALYESSHIINPTQQFGDDCDETSGLYSNNNEQHSNIISNTVPQNNFSQFDVIQLLN